MPGGAFEKVGVQAVVEGFGRYMQNLGKMDAKTKGFGGALGKLGKTALAMGAGFIAAQVSMAGVQQIMSRSIGAAVAYEAQMAEIRALTGATKEDTDLLTDAIFEMAKTMPKSPQELGAAAYFILSSGIEDAAEAADVLEVAAKASTIGLGETASVADALTTVLNAYGKSADEAGQVTDVMIEAVKQGKAEASEFAGVLGRVVPLAAQMGISFEEVSANLATFTLLGVSADEAATGLRQVMASLLKPTEQQEEAMKELGFTAEELRQQIKDKGLLATLDEMITATGGNEAAIAKLFPNIRALTSVLGTAGVQMDAYTDILAATSNATGNLDEGFAIVADTAKFKLGLAMNELNLALMDLGTIAIPIVVRLTEKLSDLIGTLEGFIDPAVDVAAATNIVADSAERADTSFNLWDAAMAGVTLNLERFKKEADDAAGKTSLLSEEIDRQLDVLEKEAAALAETGKTTRDVAEETSEFDTQVAALATRLGISEQALRDSGLSIEELENKTAGLSAEIARAPATWQSFDKELAASAMLQAELEGAMGDTGTKAAWLSGVINSLSASLKGAASANADLMSTLSDVTGQRTQETNALALQINALQLEQNAALQSEIGQTSLGGAVASTTDALSQQIGALNNLAASMVPQALNDEIAALEREITVLQQSSAAIEGQLLAREHLIRAHEEAVRAHEEAVEAVQAEVDALDDLLRKLNSTAEGLDRQIAAEKKLAAERAGTLPHSIKLAKLELQREKLLQKVGGNTEDLTEAEADRLKEIEATIEAERRAIRIKELEAEVTDLQAEATGEHIRKLEEERAEVDQQIAATAALKNERERYISTLLPPELPAEIVALQAHKQNLDADIAATENLKSQRELYIKTLVPVELLQEIDALGRQKTALDNSKAGTQGATGATRTLSDTIGDQIGRLGLQRQAIDLVTEGWRLQAEAMLGLPKMEDLRKQLLAFKALLLLQTTQSIMEALSRLDLGAVAKLTALLGKIAAFHPAAHGFHSDVAQPTMFLAGEAGPERVDITPGGTRDTVLAPQLAASSPGFDRLADLLSGQSGGMSVSVSAPSQEQIAEEVAGAMRSLAFELGRPV